MRRAFAAGDKKLYKDASDRFLRLILLQDELLATRPEFKVGTWIARARSLGNTPEEKNLYEWNARVQITTWGNRLAADEGGLRDYAHREWNGILKDFYYMRWKTWFRLSGASFGWAKNRRRSTFMPSRNPGRKQQMSIRANRKAIVFRQ